MPNGGTKCWEEFKGWLKAFTPIETLLTILEAILLVLLIVFLVFLILHFLSCRGYEVEDKRTTKLVDTTEHPFTHTKKSRPTCTYTKDESTVTTETINGNKSGQTKETQPTCTYTPSGEKLAISLGNVSAHHHHDDEYSDGSTQSDSEVNESASTEALTPVPYDDTIPTGPEAYDGIEADQSDGELADDEDKRLVLALVKSKPSGLTFGCILTVLSERWTLTAASCIDSIEEVDSLDNFVIIDHYDDLNKGRSHGVSDVRVHPLYEGRNKSYDLALLRSEDELNRQPVTLPSLLDYFKMTVGEAGRILGYGRFRTIDQSGPQRVHFAIVHLLPSSQCSPPDSIERHLLPLAPVAHGRCGLGPLCLGVLAARGAPCNYCAGAPLLRDRVLLGIMADNEQCGAACEPAMYANVAAAASWISKVLGS